MYKGFPWPSIEVIPTTISFEEDVKLEIVIGRIKSADAKIAGITPAVLTFNGRWEASPPYNLFPICLLG